MLLPSSLGSLGLRRALPARREPVHSVDATLAETLILGTAHQGRGRSLSSSSFAIAVVMVPGSMWGERRGVDWPERRYPSGRRRRLPHAPTIGTASRSVAAVVVAVSVAFSVRRGARRRTRRRDHQSIKPPHPSPMLSPRNGHIRRREYESASLSEPVALPVRNGLGHLTPVLGCSPHIK